jgi:hypothetical protein
MCHLWHVPVQPSADTSCFNIYSCIGLTEKVSSLIRMLPPRPLNPWIYFQCQRFTIMKLFLTKSSTTSFNRSTHSACDWLTDRLTNVLDPHLVKQHKEPKSGSGSKPKLVQFSSHHQNIVLNYSFHQYFPTTLTALQTAASQESWDKISICKPE